jgi:RNA polymerase sigma factor (sigma-70 family)
VALLQTMADKTQFTELIRENKGIIFKISHAYASNKEDRDDLAQEIIYNLWKSYSGSGSASGFRPDFKFSTWMYRVALNVAISFYRKERRQRGRVIYSENLLVVDDDVGLPGTEADKDLPLLLQFIGALKEIDKSIMLLYLGDKSYKEIAEITGITESNVATKLNRIKDKLKTNFLNHKNK